MINLQLLKECHSVINQSTFSGRLNFYTDTRMYRHPGAFVAIPGSKVNPLNIISELLNQGCPLVFYQQNTENNEKVTQLLKVYPQTQFIPVSDSVIFLQEIAHQHIKEWKGQNPRNTVFAISGSNGKTTHKEMISFILKEVLPGKVIATEKNNNNHLGVPLTLLNVTEKIEIVILELGSNHPGEIKILCDIAQPTAGLTTNIGATHLEFFGDEEMVFEEEAYLYHAIKSITHGKGFYLINVDDKFLKCLEPTSGSITYGESPNAMARVHFLEGGAEMHYNGESLVALNAHITGKHNKLNLITSLFITIHFYREHKLAFIEACKKFRPTKNRSEWIQFENRPVYLDAYNANPSSMKAALSAFKESLIEQGFALNESCVVLGDMNELGTSTPQYHYEVGQYVKSLGFPNVFFIGQYSEHYLAGNPDGQAKVSSASFKDEYRSRCLKNYRIHFIKGSRSLQLESLFDIT